MWELRHLTTIWASTSCYRDSFTFSCRPMIFRLASSTIKKEASHFSEMLIPIYHARLYEFTSQKTVILIVFSGFMRSPSYVTSFSLLPVTQPTATNGLDFTLSLLYPLVKSCWRRQGAWWVPSRQRMLQWSRSSNVSLLISVYRCQQRHSTALQQHY
jgi:hypothetical protein